jgi:hypothetical protein
MPNPTGSIYLAAAPGYQWADGDIYQIPQADQQEGAAVGASFSGLGVDNQPHQLLLNKIQLTHSKQLTDENNIAVIQAFDAEFASVTPAGGPLIFKTAYYDANRGLIQAIAQMGFYSTAGIHVTDPQQFTVTWPLAFPTAILVPPFCSLVLNALSPGGDPDPGFVAALSSNQTSGVFVITAAILGGDIDPAGFVWIAVGI